jgi:hypothetical protein
MFSLLVRSVGERPQTMSSLDETDMQVRSHGR